MISFDLQISQYIFSLGRAWPAWLVRFLATDLFWGLLALVLVVSWFNQTTAPGRRFRLAAQAVGAAALALGLNAVIGWLYFRHRPFVDLVFTPLVNISPLEKSFPSDHAAAAFAFATTVWLQQKRSGRWAIAAAGLIALGRVLAGVHYFSDILVGAALGGGLAYAFNVYVSRARNLFNSLLGFL